MNLKACLNGVEAKDPRFCREMNPGSRITVLWQIDLYQISSVGST